MATPKLSDVVAVVEALPDAAVLLNEQRCEKDGCGWAG